MIYRITCTYVHNVQGFPKKTPQFFLQYIPQYRRSFGLCVSIPRQTHTSLRHTDLPNKQQHCQTGYYVKAQKVDVKTAFDLVIFVQDA